MPSDFLPEIDLPGQTEQLIVRVGAGDVAKCRQAWPGEVVHVRLTKSQDHVGLQIASAPGISAWLRLRVPVA